MLIINRLEILIRLRFRAISKFIYKDFILYKIFATVIRYNITIFLRYKLSKIREEFSILSNWPRD